MTLPATPGDRLINIVKSKLEGAGVKGILVSSDGSQVSSSSLVKSNPFPRMDCARVNCMVCWGEPSGGKCAKSGACYTVTCNRLPCRVINDGEGDRSNDIQIPMAQYAGETSRTPYTRGARNLALYTGSEKEKSKSFMWRHCLEVHGGVIGNQGGGRRFQNGNTRPLQRPFGQGSERSN